MSKSEWRELPQWDDTKNYAFMQGAKPEVWAWEFLRRDPEYRADWQQVTDLKKNIGQGWMLHPDLRVYLPPKQQEETESRWMSRAVCNGVEPIKTRLDLYLAGKWALKELYDPSRPYSQEVRFIKPGSEFPRLLHTPDDFYELVEEEDADGLAIQHVSNGNAVIAFDITAPITGIGEKTEKVLRKWKNKMLRAGKIKKAPSHAGKIKKWTRHLQVLDARRTTPPAKYVQIAKKLALKKSKGAALVDPRKEAEKFLTQARKTMKDYRKILLFKSTSCQALLICMMRNYAG